MSNNKLQGLSTRAKELREINPQLTWQEALQHAGAELRAKNQSSKGKVSNEAIAVATSHAFIRR